MYETFKALNQIPMLFVPRNVLKCHIYRLNKMYIPISLAFYSYKLDPTSAFIFG